jgi:hypothetical protein
VSLSVKDGVVMARTPTGLKPLDEIPPSATMVGVPTATTTTTDERPYEIDRPRRSKPLKPQITGFEMGVLATAGVGVDTIPGVFTFVDVSLIERFPFGLLLSAHGNFGAGTGSFDAGSRQTGPFGGDVQLATFEALLGFDTRYFALSIGAGAALRQEGYDTKPLFAIRGRGGEVDGFTFTWHASFSIESPDAFGVFGGMLELPLTRTWWIGTDAEIGSLRYGRFMVDLRHRFAGTGYGGTFDVRVSAGLALMRSVADCNQPLSNGVSPNDTECLGTNSDYLGPAVSLGFLWRP